MTRQSLYLREVAILIDELVGRHTVRAIRDYLKKHGMLEFDEHDRDLWELEKTRKLIQAVRRFTNKEESGPVEMVNLFETQDDGTKVEFYQPIEECSVDQAVQHLKYWHKFRTTAEGKLRHYFQVFSEMHGRREIQRRLNFTIPKERNAARKAAKDSFKTA